MSHPKTILIHSVRKICGIDHPPYPLRLGKAMSFLQSIDDAYLLIENGTITDFGPMSNCAYENVDLHINAQDRFLLPAWVDSHTHIVFAKTREAEFVDRIKGLSYAEIAANGGGILNSARVLQETSFEDLYASAEQRLLEVQRKGTGTIEIKSGYGLSFDAEIKMLQVIKQLKRSHPAMNIHATFLGAHAIPLKYKENRQEYIRIITDEMLPYIADNQLANYCDVFCDEGFYTVKETDLILKKAASYGLKAKIHANELAVSGGVQVGIANSAISVDHLEEITEVEIDALKNSHTIPTLLPGTSFFLNIPYAPARKMIDSGLGIALATDYNPGSTPSGDMSFLLSLACLKMRLLPEEAINAVTINAAHALESQDLVGSIAIGKEAKLVLTKPIDSLARIPYSYGSSVIDFTILNDQIIKASDM